VMMLCWGLGPGAQIVRLTSTNAAMSRPLNAKVKHTYIVSE